MLRGKMNGMPLGIAEEIPREGYAIEGEFSDVHRACADWLKTWAPRPKSREFRFGRRNPKVEAPTHNP